MRMVIVHQSCHQCGSKMPPSMGNLCRRCEASVEPETSAPGCGFLATMDTAVVLMIVCWFFNI